MTTPISIDGKSFEFSDEEIKGIKLLSNLVYSDAILSVSHEKAQVECLKHFIQLLHRLAATKTQNDRKNPIRKS